jgi:hypothetical protein
MKLTLLLLAIGLHACTSQRPKSNGLISEATPARVSAAAPTPDYTEAIREEIARNPPGDYDNGVPFAIGRSKSPPPEAPTDILTATIQAVEADIRSLDAELSEHHLAGSELQQKLSERAKLTHELQSFKDLKSHQP